MYKTNQWSHLIIQFLMKNSSTDKSTLLECMYVCISVMEAFSKSPTSLTNIIYVSRKVNLIFTLRSNRKFCFKNDGSNSLNILSVVIIELVINTLVKDSAFQEYYEFHLCKQNDDMMRIVTDSFYAI